MRRLGFVGLGNMGEPMARRLAEAGHEVVGYDASNAAGQGLEGLAGFTRVELIRQVAAGADAVILMLPTSDVVRRVLFDDDLLSELTPGSLVIDMGSSRPEHTQKTAADAELHQVRIVDAPVSGGVSAAHDGSLAIMVGGPEAWVKECSSVLQILGSRVLHVGPVGAGHALKAINNLLSASHLLAGSEALVIGTRFGLDPYVMMDAINGSSGRSGSTMSKWPHFILPETYDSGFMLRLMLKDAQIAAELARACDVPAPYTDATVALWKAAADFLPPEADHTEIHRWVVERTRKAADKPE